MTAPPMTDAELEALEKLDREATPGPWSWTHIGEKTNGYILGFACDGNGKPLEGYVDFEDVVEPVLNTSLVGEHEAATCSYRDPELICASRTALPRLVAEIRALRTLSELQDKLLACYRTGRNPGSILDKLRAARAVLSPADREDGT